VASDTRAHLRRSKLWKYTQEDAPEEAKNKDKWEKAADLMTPTLSAEIKRKLTEEDFNNGYKMLTKLSRLLQPSGEAQFMRLNREYYTLRYNDHGSESMSDFLTRVKVLEERIDSTNVQMDNDKRTLLCLSMSLPARYRSLIQIWSVTDGMTAEKAMEMVLEEDLRTAEEEGGGMEIALTGWGGKKVDGTCWHCGKKGHRRTIAMSCTQKRRRNRRPMRLEGIMRTPYVCRKGLGCGLDLDLASVVGLADCCFASLAALEVAE